MSEFSDKINALEIKEKLEDLNDKMDYQFAISQATSNEEKAKIWDNYVALRDQRFEQRLELNKTLFEKPVYKPIEFID
jgi:hypothetical protein